MLLRNIGSKIINVGPVVLMPGNDMTITEKEAGTPAIKALCKKGLLAVEKDAAEPVKEEQPAEPVEELVKAPEDGEEPEPEKEEPKTQGRRKKAQKNPG